MKYGDEVTAVELHALDDVEFDRHAFGLFDRDDALVADPLHGARQHVADLALAVGGDGADLGDLRGGRDLPGPCLDVRDGRFDSHVDAALEVHRVHAGGDGLDALADDGLGQHGRGGGAVTGLGAGFAGHLANHLGAHVLEVIGQLDFLGDRHAVLGDARGTV